MPFPLRKSHDFVFERRTVSWPDALDLAVEERRARDVLPDDVVDPISCVEQVAIDLGTANQTSQEGKRDWRNIALFAGERTSQDPLPEVDAVSIQPRGSTGLETAPFEAERFERFGEIT